MNGRQHLSPPSENRGGWGTLFVGITTESKSWERRVKGGAPGCQNTYVGPESPRLGQYFFTVRGDTRIPSFSDSSSATRSCPQVGLLLAISTINRRMSFGNGGLPPRDFHRQNRRKAWRCQPIKVSGFTLTRALFQSNSWAISSSEIRAGSSNRRGLI